MVPCSTVLCSNDSLSVGFNNFYLLLINQSFPIILLKCLNYNKAKMHQEDDIINRIIGKLEFAITQVRTRQRQLMQEVLQMEKIINKMQDTKPAIKKIDKATIEKQQEKEVDTTNTQKYSKKIEQMIQSTEQALKNIDNPNKDKQNYHFQKKVEPLPAIQKKPPIPTVNRAKQTHQNSYLPKPNPHRNKNQVTPKITQTPYQGRKSNSIQPKIDQKTSFSINSQKNQSSSKKLNDKKLSLSAQKANNVKSQKRPIQFFFQSFPYSIEQLISKRQSKGNRKSRKGQIDKLIQEYQREEIGHKQNNSKYLHHFLQSISRIASMRKILPISNPFQIKDRKWTQNDIIFKFQNIIDYFQQLLTNNPISQQYELDPKICYRINYYYSLLNQIFDQQVEKVKNTMKLPPKIGIEFQMNFGPGKQGSTIQSQKSQAEIQFYVLLEELLMQLQELKSFDKQALKTLRLLISIILYNGRRSPVMIQIDKFEEWKAHYCQQTEP